MAKMTKFQGYLEYQGKIWGEKMHKVYKSIYQLTILTILTILSAFHCFLFHKNIPNTFEVIALLVKTDIIFSNFSVNFCLV